MPLTAIVTAVLLATSGAAVAADQPVRDTTDVAYAELTSGKAQAAVTKLEAKRVRDSSDPATLINLGAAYEQAGMTDKALNAYRAAVDTPVRYDLELADGSWSDSRAAARKALKGMLASRSMASR